jgi:hypothetical protein
MQSCTLDPVRLTRLFPALILIVACTPIGAWVYDDPSFALRSAVLRPAPDPGTGVDSLDLVFASCNRNDYDLLGEAFETSMTIGGQPVGQGKREQPYFLATRDTSPVQITLAMAPAWGGSSKEMPFEVVSALLLKVPTGDRRIDIRQRGTIVRSDTGLRLKGNLGWACRPGGSRLPAEFTRKVPIGPADPNPSRPAGGYGPAGSP